MDFSKETTTIFNKHVNIQLNSLTCNEHEKYIKTLSNKTK